MLVIDLIPVVGVRVGVGGESRNFYPNTQKPSNPRSLRSKFSVVYSFLSYLSIHTHPCAASSSPPNLSGKFNRFLF